MKSEDSQAKPGSSFSEHIGERPLARLLRLTPAVYAAIRAHGEETYPDECCGALLGHSTPEGWRIEAAVRVGNARADSAHNRYQIAPADLVKIEREARRLGLEIAGFYHSHPDHPAHWSPTDLEEAHWLGCCHVITCVAQGKATETNSFLLNGLSEEDKRFDPLVIQVDDKSIGPDRNCF
jgi:proteasome lid subunit RPN8/RPN11